MPCANKNRAHEMAAKGRPASSRQRGKMPAPRQDYHARLSTWRQPKPDNDNHRITADSFAELAARRAFIQREQRDPAPVLSLPTLERLARTAPDAVDLWKFWRDLQCAPAADVFVLPEIIVAEGEEPANPGFSE